MAAKVIADAKTVSSLTLDGSISGSNGTETIHIAIKPAQGCTGTMGAGSRAASSSPRSATPLPNPDKKFWEAFGGANASQVITLVDGRYLKVSSSDKAMGSLASICDVKQMFSTNGKQDAIAKGKVTALDGTRVLALKDTADDSVAYVTDTSKPQLFELTSPKGAKDGSGKITVTYDAPVKLIAPPASQVLDGSQLGL